MPHRRRLPTLPICDIPSIPRSTASSRPCWGPSPKEGESYRKLRPTYAIWLLGQTLLPDDPDYAHEFRMRDQRGRAFLDHGGIWLLELSKFATDTVETEE